MRYRASDVYLVIISPGIQVPLTVFLSNKAEGEGQLEDCEPSRHHPHSPSTHGVLPRCTARLSRGWRFEECFGM